MTLFPGFQAIESQSAMGLSLMRIMSQELLNVVAGNFEIGLSIVINAHHNHNSKLKLDRDWFQKEVFSIPDKGNLRHSA